MSTLRYVVADVFTDTPLAGNQLAVFTDARGVDDATMQALALEIGFSETVFVLPPQGGGNARIRIFTPAFELPFAGHPTLGTAFVLGAPLQLGVITLETGGETFPSCSSGTTPGASCSAGWSSRCPPSIRTLPRPACSRLSGWPGPTFPSSGTTTGRRSSSSHSAPKRRCPLCVRIRQPSPHSV